MQRLKTYLQCFWDYVMLFLLLLRLSETCWCIQLNLLFAASCNSKLAQTCKNSILQHKQTKDGNTECSSLRWNRNASIKRIPIWSIFHIHMSSLIIESYKMMWSSSYKFQYWQHCIYVQNRALHAGYIVLIASVTFTVVSDLLWMKLVHFFTLIYIFLSSATFWCFTFCTFFFCYIMLWFFAFVMTESSQTLLYLFSWFYMIVFLRQ